MFDSKSVGDSKVHDIFVSGGSVYTLLSSRYSDEGDMFYLYRIVGLDGNLKPISMAEDIYIDPGETVTGFSYDSEDFYITAVKLDGSALNVYDMCKAVQKDMVKIGRAHV